MLTTTPTVVSNSTPTPQVRRDRFFDGNEYSRSAAAVLGFDPESEAEAKRCRFGLAAAEWARYVCEHEHFFYVLRPLGPLFFSCFLSKSFLASPSRLYSRLLLLFLFIFIKTRLDLDLTLDGKMLLVGRTPFPLTAESADDD